MSTTISHTCNYSKHCLDYILARSSSYMTTLYPLLGIEALLRMLKRSLRVDQEPELRPKDGVFPLAATLKWKPWQITLALAAITQIYTYYRPKYAFELFAVWERKE